MYPPDGDPERTDITGQFEFVNAMFNAGFPEDGNAHEQNQEDPEFEAGLSSSPTAVFLSTGEFPGPYNFTVSLDQSGKSSWVYSSVLHQVFIDKDKILMLNFQMNPISPKMLIRAVPVYTSPDDLSKPVNRCPLHAKEDDPSSQAHTINGECMCTDFGLPGHVVRTYSLEAKYCFDRVSQRHSVVVPAISPEQGSDFVKIPYTFSCKTSCQNGMQRRPIKVVFTLENQNGKVFGRRVLEVKICSCPKRDMERMEIMKDKPTVNLEASQFDQNEILEESKDSSSLQQDVPSISEEEKKAQRRVIIGEMKRAFLFILKKTEELQRLC